VTKSASWAARPGGPRPHFTGRAAILAIVLCAIALSLAYPVREYIEQRRQIDQLQAQRSQIVLHLKNLEHERKRLNSPSFIEQQARDRLHMCLPTQMCYVVIAPATRNGKAAKAPADSVPWYARLWSSVQQANQPQPVRARHG
jgi:cell division protein FtsB